MPKRTILAALTTATALAAAALAVPPSAQAAATPKAVPHTKPSWLGQAHHLGAAKSTATVHARVYLAPKGGLDAVKQVALAMATPGNSSYHKFLTTAQYRARFGTTDQTVRSVEKYLRSSGLHVSGVGASNRYIVVTGTVAAAHKAFGTSIQRYRHAGQTVQAPNSAVTVPAALASSVLAVSGLDTTVHKVTTAQKIDPPAGYRNARPCSAYFGQLSAKYQSDFHTKLPKFRGQTLSYAPCGYTGPQFRAAYEGSTTLDGAGATVAIIDAFGSNYIAQDANHYATVHGDGSYLPGQFKQYLNTPFTHTGDPSATDPNGCGASGWSTEETLDVEAVHAMAPGANIRYYGAKSCNDDDILDTQAKVVADDTAQIVTNSYGEPDEALSTDLIAASEAVFVQGAVEGISFAFSSGDNGDELANTSIKQTDSSASDPYVTAVGGTALGIGADGSITFQTGWGTESHALSATGKSWGPGTFNGGAGGGYSTLFNRPAYQNGTVRSPYRGEPDVAMDADPNTGILIGLHQTFSDGVYYDEFRVGGTSVASPLFAGMTALKIQANNGQGYGLLNPTIYAKANRAAFTDVTPTPKYIGDVRVNFTNGEDASGGLTYFVRTFNQDSSLTTTKGWDTVTGLGSPNTVWLKK